MTDLVQKLVGALEELLHECEQGIATSPHARIEARAALSAAKAGGWVAVQSEPWGWAIVSNDGTTQATRARIHDFFGSHLEMPPYMQAEIDQVDREFAGHAPHRVVTLHPLPAPPAQRGEG